jgi:hypothetical protein
MVEVLVNPRGLSVDVLNDDTGDLLSSCARRNTYAVRLTHEAESNNNPRTETLATIRAMAPSTGNRLGIISLSHSGEDYAG